MPVACICLVALDEESKWIKDRFTAHQLRHTYATMLYDAGVDVKTAQDFLGHADPTVTMNIYTHLSSQKKEKAILALQQHFSDKIPEAL